MFTRRHILVSTLAAPAILRFGTGTAQAATTLKISHQFPGGTIDKGDFRDRLCRVFAAEVAKRSGGEIAAEVYPNSSLIKTNAQFSAMRKGALDISLYPLCRWRIAGDQYRPDARHCFDLRPGHELEEKSGRQVARRLPRR
jgi:TRAP-type C4-dicarboxylate transport system substrate-binding protein